MWGPLRTVVEVVYGPAELYSGITSVAYTGLVFLGGLAVWWLLAWLLEYTVLGAERATLWVYAGWGKGHFDWTRRPRTFGASFRHLAVQAVFFAGALLIFWIACASSGFNPWTTGAAALGISIFITYVFMTPLGQFGSGMSVLATGVIARGQYWEFAGMPGYDGRIIAIYTLQVELERWDEEAQTAYTILVPIGTFLTQPCRRNYNREINAKRVTRTDAEHAFAKVRLV